MADINIFVRLGEGNKPEMETRCAFPGDMYVDQDGNVDEVLVNEHQNKHGFSGRWVLCDGGEGVNSVYDEDAKKFVPEQPFPSWVWDLEEFTWKPPVPRPTHYEGGPLYEWDESIIGWKPFYGADHGIEFS